MVLLSCVYVLVLVLNVDGYLGRGGKEESIEEYEKICDKVLEKPNFKNELVIGITWRVYYTWNVVPDKSCRDMTFKKVDPLMVNHVRMRVQQYLQAKPNWADASLFLTMSRYRRILLLLDENQTPGSFIQIPLVPTTIFTNNPDRRQIPLFSMVMKLVHDDRYLIMSDCSAGVTFLLGHRTYSPHWREIKSIARSYINFGEGMLSCERST